MNSDYDNQRLENLKFGFDKKKVDTDQEIIENFLAENDEERLDCNDDITIEPYEMKDTSNLTCKFDQNGKLVLENNDDDQYDSIKNRVEQVKIERFSLENDIRHGIFDPNGNFIPVDEESEEEEEEFEPSDDGIVFDVNLALESMRFLLTVMNRHETVCQTFNRLNDNQDDIRNLTTAASQLQFMGMDNIYNMKRKEIGSHYNKLLNNNDDF